MGETLLPILSFAIILVPLIFVHELGHFVMAKLAGITVLEFGIGFPPRITVLFKRGDTEYTLNWLPLGGFVRPLGEDAVRPLSDEETQKERARLVQSHPDAKEPTAGVAVSDVSPARRMLFMAGGPLFNIAAAVFLFAAAGLAGQPAIDHTDITVVSVDWNSPLVRAGVRPGDVIRAVDGTPVDFAKDLVDYLAAHNGASITLTVERGGSTFDLTAAPGAAESARFVDGSTVVVGTVNADSPALAAGLKANDIIIGGATESRYPAPGLGIAQIGDPQAPTARILDDRRLYNATRASRLIFASVGRPLTLTVLRDGAPRQITTATRAHPPQGEGPTGITLSDEYPMTVIYQSPPEALVGGVGQTIEMIYRVIQAPILILRGELPGEAARPVSIVGISQLGSEFLKESVASSTAAPALQYAALISIALGITNLLPLPALDGGRILFALIELIRGKRMNPEREGLIHMIGLMALMALMVLLIIADIADPVQLP